MCIKFVFEYEKCKEDRSIKKSDLRAFYRHVNKKLDFSSGVGSLKAPSGQMVTEDNEKATLLNGYFSSVFTSCLLYTSDAADE